MLARLRRGRTGNEGEGWERMGEIRKIEGLLWRAVELVRPRRGGERRGGEMKGWEIRG